jgi:dihydrofolate reductase
MEQMWPERGRRVHAGRGSKADAFANWLGEGKLKMRKIKIIEHISLDGVIQAPGGPNEDGDYPYGGWTRRYRDPAGGEAILAAHGKGFDLLLGRRTYDIWAGFWPKAGNGPLADGLNAATKYVATHRPASLEWGPFEALGPDIVEGVRRIKAKDGPDLIVWGSSTLTSMLLEHGFADEVLLFVYPVLLGKGKRFFSDGTPPCQLALAGMKAVSSGVVIGTYTPTGPLRTGCFDDAN